MEEDTALAWSHYKDLKRMKQERHESLIFHLRNLNNYVKAVLVQTYLSIKLVSSENEDDDKGVRILELCCEKGGDFSKLFAKKGVTQYMGADLVFESLAEAVDRVRALQKTSYSLNIPSDIKFICVDLQKADLVENDWGNPYEEGLKVWDSVSGEWHNEKKEIFASSQKFEFISMQFSLHYLLRSRETVENLFAGIAYRLTPHGYFVCTTVDPRSLISEILNSQTPMPEGPNNFLIEMKDEKGRAICSLEFEIGTLNKLFSGPGEFGLKYHFKLFDQEHQPAVDVPEFIVPTSLLLEVAEEFNLELVEQSRFTDYVEKNISSTKGLWLNMNVPDSQGKVYSLDWRIASLYQVLVLRKQSHANKHVEFLELLEQRKSADWSSLSKIEKTERIRAGIARKIQRNKV